MRGIATGVSMTFGGFAVLMMSLLWMAGCNDELVGQAGVGQVCSADLDCVVGLKCIDNRCTPEALNGVPEAVPGPNKVTVQGFLTSLDGSASSDPDGDTLSFRWGLVSKPGGSAVTLGGEVLDDASTLTFRPDAPGVYELTLTVSDGRDSSLPGKVAVFVFDQDGNFPTLADGEACLESFQCASGDCTDGVCVSNFRPTAAAGPSREVALGETVVLDGSNSSDPDGDALAFYWQLTQTPSGSVALLDASDSVVASFVADVEGLYVATLRVNDGKLSSDVASVGIYAGDQVGLRDDGEPCTQDSECLSNFCFADACKTNEVPVADPGAPQVVDLGTILTFDGSNSEDPEQQPLTYAWDINKAPEGSTATLTGADTVSPSLAPDIAGLYLLRLVVSDGNSTSLPAVVVAVVQTSEGLGIGEPCVDNGECASNKCVGSACAGNSAPIAVAGPAQEVPVGATVTLDGSASSDGDGDPIAYLWTLTAPEGSTATLDDATAVAPTFVADIEGIYQVGLVVEDGNLTSVESVTAVVALTEVEGLPNGSPCVTDDQCESAYCGGAGCATNSAPMAVVEDLIYGVPGDPVTLDGTGSNDAEGQPLSFTWTLTDVPNASSATITDPTQAQPTLTPDIAGVYFFELVVDDGYALSQPAVGALIVQAGAPVGSPCADDAQCLSGLCDGTNVCVTNLPPLADAGPAQVVEVNALVTLDGAASSDPEGRPLTYVWSLVTVPAGSAASLDDNTATSPSFTADVEGLYLARLTVSDGYNLQEAGVAVVALPGGLLGDGEPCTLDSQCQSGDCTGDVCVTNGIPVAQIEAPVDVTLGLPFTVVGTASSDPDDDPLSYAWTLISTPAGSAAALATSDEPTATVTPDLPGTYSFLLLVNDGKVDSAPVGVNVTVGPNDAPVASLVIVSTPPFLVGEAVTLDASGSSDPNGDSLSYAWDFLTAPPSSSATIAGSAETGTLTPDVPGTYVARLTVSDGVLSDIELAVIVVPGVNAPPVADAGSDTQMLSGSPLFLFGHNSSDPDGDALTFSWTVVSQPSGANLSITDATTPVASATPTVEGEYTFELEVADGQETAVDTVTITVATAEVPLGDYWGWVGTLSDSRVLYYVDNTTYERWTFQPGFADVASGVSGVLLDRERLGPWADQDVFDWVVDWDPAQGLVLTGLHGEVPGLGTVTTAAEPPLVLYPLSVFSAGSQTFYSLVQTVDGSGAPISEVMRRTIRLDPDATPNPAPDFSNGVAGGLGTDALMLEVRTKTGQAPEVFALQSLVDAQGLFGERRAPGINNAVDLYAPSTAVQTLALTFNDAVPTPGGAVVEPATIATPLVHAPNFCVQDPSPCSDNLNVSSPSADCPVDRQYCRFEGTCTWSSSTFYPTCPSDRQSYSPFDPLQDADWSGTAPIWVDPLDQVEVPGIPSGMEVTGVYLATGDTSFNVDAWEDQYMLYGLLQFDSEPFPNMKYTIALRQNPPADTVGDVFIEFTFDGSGGGGFPSGEDGPQKNGPFPGGLFGPWTMTATQAVSFGLGPNIACDGVVSATDNGLAFRIPMFAHGGWDSQTGDQLPSIFELLQGYDPESYGETQDESKRAIVQVEACGLYADGCSDAVLAPLTVDLQQPGWMDSFDYCNYGGGEF